MNQKPSISNIFTAENVKRGLNLVGHLLTTRKFWIELIIMTLGMFVAALGVYFFLIPSKLIVGSITGLSIVTSKLLPFLSVGTVIFTINAILLVLSFLLIGNEFGAKTVYTALILGPMIDFLGKVVPIKESIFTTYINVGGGLPDQAIANPWFDLLCFVIILSASQSILFSINASTGGLDILGKIINKYTGINIGTSVSIAGILICCTAFSINDPNLVLIGIIGTWLNGIILSRFMLNMNSRNRVFIISKDYERIKEYVVNTLNRGVTMHEVIGGYSNVKSIQLEIILTRNEFLKLMTFIGEQHIESFCTTDSVSEVHGLWNKSKNTKELA